MSDEPSIQNDNLVLICGKSATGKTASLMDINDHPGVMYLNCESGKKIPFKNKFWVGPEGKRGVVITDPYQVYECFNYAETLPEIHTIVIDTLTYLMDMFESVHVLGAKNTMEMWGKYAQFFKNLMQQYVAKSSKNVIFLAHTSDVMNESELTMDTLVKVKGSLMNQGIESYFSTVIASKKMAIKHLTDYENDLLNISDEEKALGYKYVYQTKLTKDTVNERIRSSIGMWDTKETYIDNNVQHVLDRLHEYYEDL